MPLSSDVSFAEKQIEGGEAAGIARKAVEERTGVPVITAKNAAQLNQVVTDLLEGATTSPEKQDKRH